MNTTQTPPDAATLVRLAKMPWRQPVPPEDREAVERCQISDDSHLEHTLGRLLADAYEARDAEVRELRAALKRAANSLESDNDPERYESHKEIVAFFDKYPESHRGHVFKARNQGEVA